MTTIAQWELFSGGAELAPATLVTLRNRNEQQSLRYGEREYGIELVWDEATDLRNFAVFPERTGDDRITYAAPVALRFNGGGFLWYDERDYGINLRWSAEPRFQWEITGGPPGAPVPLNRPIALLNTFHGDHLIYDEREYGINLRWYADFDLWPNPAFNQAAFAKYLPLPMPNSLRAPGRESTQMQVSGIARKVQLFHGEDDDELDWHVYVSLDPAARRALADHLTRHARGGSDISYDDLDQLYCELMVLDGERTPTLFGDDRFFSADVARAFALNQGESAWNISDQAGDVQGEDLPLSDRSRLTRNEARVWMQGPFVNDAAHGFRLEIHPLDSIAYLVVGDGRPLAVAPDDDWPEHGLTWRVAAFTNSTIHRIHNADYLKQEREITWLLDLPRADRQTEPADPFHPDEGETSSDLVTVEVTEPGFANRGAGAEDIETARPGGTQYTRHGVVAAEHELTPRAADGRRFLRVVVRLGEPDRWGGMFLAEYKITVGPPGLFLAARRRQPESAHAWPDAATAVRAKSPDASGQ